MEEQAKGPTDAQANVPAAPSQPVQSTSVMTPLATPATPDKGSVAPSAQPAAPTTEVVGGLDLSKLPEEHRQVVRDWADKREKDQLRYLTKKSEEYQVASKKAQYYDEYVNSNEYAEFKHWAQNKNQPQPTASQQSAADFREFTSLGYSDEEAAKLAQIVDRRLDSMINQRFQQKETEWVSRFNQVSQPVQEVKARQDLDALAQVHPDVHELMASGVFKAAASEFIAAGKNPTVEQIYSRAKELESFFIDKANQRYKQDVKTKQEAVTATPTPSGDIQVVYVDNPKQINDVAARYISQGKKVKVLLKPK